MKEGESEDHEGSVAFSILRYVESEDYVGIVVFSILRYVESEDHVGIVAFLILQYAVVAIVLVLQNLARSHQTMACRDEGLLEHRCFL